MSEHLWQGWLMILNSKQPSLLLNLSYCKKAAYSMQLRWAECLIHLRVLPKVKFGVCFSQEHSYPLETIVSEAQKKLRSRTVTSFAK